MRVPRLFKKPLDPSEIHTYTQDLASLQEQRSVALNAGETEEAKRYDYIIEVAQTVLQRLLEAGK